MSRRTSLPGADELFRTTGGDLRDEPQLEARPSERDRHDVREAREAPVAGASGASGVGGAPARAPLGGSTQSVSAASSAAADAGGGSGDGIGDLLDGDLRTTPVRHTGVRRRARTVGERRPSGRERHEEKITVYVSNEELMDLEHARLGLRGDHGLAVDRGRIVREALAVVLADFEAKGETSILVRRLTGR